MKKNDEVISIITDYTHDGLGIFKIDNFPLFIEDVIVGEKVKAKIIKIKKNLGYAKVLEILEKSPKRVEVNEKTSGANLLHMNYSEQLRFKTEKVKNIINKLVSDKNITVRPTIGMKNPYNYRNKSVVPIQKDGNVIKMGYYRPRTHDVVDIKNCSIQYQEHNILINKLREIIKKLNISIYDEKFNKGDLRHIMFRTNSTKTEIMIGIISTKKFKKIEEFVEEILKIDTRIKSIVLNINSKNTNVIFGEKTEVLYGNEYIVDKLDDIQFNISLKSFYQVNPIQTKILYKKAIELADFSKEDTIIDAYCGIGTISLFVAKKVKKVYGIEVVEQAIKNAKENAKNNNINNVEFILGKSEDIIKDLLKKDIILNGVIVDPPRKGCEESFLKDLSSLNISKIVYISCNPATLARDIEILNKLGYKCNEIQPVDMFPGTHHVECVTLLTRR